MKGGIMCLSIETNNCQIKFIDSKKYVNGKLIDLCKTFKVPQELSKSSIEHNYTADSW